MVKTIQQLIDEANDPAAMKAFVDVALGTATKKKVKKFVTGKDPKTGRKTRTQIEEVVTEQEGKPDKQTLWKLMELTGDLQNVDTMLKSKKLDSFERDEEEEEELYNEAEGLL